LARPQSFSRKRASTRVLDSNLLAKLGITTHRHETEVRSTMEIALDLASSRRASVIVTADRQTVGRGRAGRTWHSSGGGLHFSLGLWRPALRPPNLYILAASLATVDILIALGVRARIRWPNDVLAVWWDGERKISGAIAEVHGDVLVLGVGINVKGRVAEWPDDLRTSAVTLEDLAIDAERSDLLAAWLTRLDRRAHSSGTLIQEYTRHCGTIGRRVSATTHDSTVVGEAVGISPEGFLTVRQTDGDRTIEDCRLLREL